MKSTDAIASHNGNSYDLGRLQEIVQKVSNYKNLSKEDVVILQKASSTGLEQNRKYTYALGRYYNKANNLETLLKDITTKLSQGLYIVNDVLNALIYELSEGRQITNAAQEKLTDLLTTNSYPQLNAKIIVVLNKSIHLEEDFQNIHHLMNKLGSILTSEDNIVNSNIFKTLEDSFNKTRTLAQGTVPNLLKLATDTNCFYKIRDKALNLLLQALEKGGVFDDVVMLNSNLINDSDQLLKTKSVRILEINELNKTRFKAENNNNDLLIESDENIDDVNSNNKNQHVLIEEISFLNQNNPEILKLVESNYLLQTLQNVEKAYQEDSNLLPQELPIILWQRSNIISWSKEILAKKLSITESCLTETLAVINRANCLHSGYKLRPIQVMAVLSLLNSKQHGRLAQIATGEGKSTITATLAAVYALAGEYVDVITSSPILAARDANEKSGFFQILGLTVSDNTDAIASDASKACYKANIVYGDVSGFQFDLLKDEYKGFRTRGGRIFGTAIVDEVDSMLIDEGGKIAKLSSQIFGMEYLEPLLMGVWQQLSVIQNKYSYQHSTDQLLWINGEFSNEEGELILLEGTNEDDIHFVDNAEEFTTKLLEDYISSLISEQSINIPNHLIEFVQTQAKYWAKSALVALGMEENRSYIIIDDSDEGKTIAPVAYDSTGITQENTQWGDGIHQFLQIKHGLKIKPEGLNSCFISNMAYFQRYGNKIYGMTGTLGSASSQKLLQESYNVDFAFIPTYKPKKFRELEAIVCNGADEWLECIIEDIITETEKARACLVISETIADSMDIEKQLKDKGLPSDKIINYYRSNNSNQETLLGNKLGSGNIIVATNLAGRGTDIKTSNELESNGGLHVILTFLPSNLRVEQQAFGRTSRQGNEGTGRLIINSDYERVKCTKSYPDYQELAQNIEQFKEWRDLAEVKRIKDIEVNKVPKLKLEDSLFNQFKQLVQSLGGHKKKNENYKLKQLEELWGLWFKNITHAENYTLEFENKVKAEFNEFRQKLVKQYHDQNQIMRNPVYLTYQAFNKMGESGGYQESIDLYEQATKLDEKFSFAAHYNAAYAILRQTGSNNKINTEGASNAARHLSFAKDQIANYIIPAWQSMKIMLDPSHNNSQLANQIHSKIDLLNIQINYIDEALEVIHNAGGGRVVKVKDPRFLDSLYPFGAAPKEEILELNNAGIQRLYQVEAVKPPKNIVTNICIAVLGVAQIVVGIAFSFATAGLGAKMSASVIAEGIKDIYAAVKASINGETMDFQEYWADKGMSYAIAMIAVGVDSMRTSANATRQVVGEGSKEIVQKTLTEKLVDVGKQAVFTVIKEEGSLSLARGISGALNKFRGSVKKDAINDVEKVLEQPHIAKALSEILAVDNFSGDNYYQSILMQKVEEALKPHERQLYDLSKRLVNAVSHHSGALAVASNAMEAAGYAEAIERFNKILDNFCKDLERFILETQSQLPKTDRLLAGKLRLDSDSAKRIVADLTKGGIINGERSFNISLLGSGGFVPGVSSNTKPQAGVTPFILPDLNQPSGKTSTIENIDFGDNYSGYRKQIAIKAVLNLHTAYSADYRAQRHHLAQHLGQSVGASMIRTLQTGLIQPASSIAVHSGVNKMHSLMQEHNRKVRENVLREKLISSLPPEIILEELLGRAESLSNLVPVSTGLSAGDEPLSDVDTFSTLAYTAEKIIVWAKDYAEFAEKYPNLAENLLPAISISTKAIIGGVVGSAGGPIGSALGATTGLLAGVGSEVQGMLINEVAGEKISETISYAIDKATDLWKSLDPSLTEDQARALGAAGVIGVMTGAQGKTAAKEALHFAANLKPAKTSHGFLNFFREKDQSRKIREGSVGTRVTTHAPKSTKLVVDGKPAFYADAPYHHPNSTGMIKSKAPTRGAEMLEHSMLVKPETTTRRVAVDKINKEIIIFDLTVVSPNSIEYHGHVKEWSTITDDKIRNFLIKNNMVDSKGRVIK